MAWHAKLSASQTKTWWNCPGSLAFLEANPELKRESGSHARLGTCAHYLLELCLENGVLPDHYGGRLIRIEVNADGSDGDTVLLDAGAEAQDDMDHEVDLDMVEAVEHCVSYVRSRLLELTGDESTTKAIENGTLRVEQRVNPLPHRDDTGGTGDVLIDIWPEVFEIVDYKHGSGVFVPVEGNYQLRSYLGGGCHKYDAFDYELLQYTICQPRHIQAPYNGIMSEQISSKDLKKWLSQLDTAASRVDEARELVHTHMMDAGAAQEDPTLLLDSLYNKGFISVGQEGGSHCTFCDIKAWCPAARDKAQEVAAVDFADEPEEIDKPGPNQIAVVMPWVDFLDKWLKDVNIAAEHTLLAGGKIDGFKVVRGKANRVLKPNIDDDKLVATAVKFGAKKEDCFKPPVAPKVKTGPQLEKLLPAAKRKAFSDEVMHKPEGKLTVVPVSDKRPAVDVTPGGDFDDDL